MDLNLALVALLIAIAAAAIVWGVLNGRRAAELTALVAQRDASGARLQEELLAARQECARVGAQLEAARAAAAEKITLLEGTDTRLREAFAALSADALKRNNESFLQLARTADFEPRGRKVLLQRRLHRRLVFHDE